MAQYLSAIILAAGFSSRMGALKALLPLGEQTMLEQSLALFRDGGIEDLVVVTGHRADAIRTIAERAGARIAHNPDFAAGMFSSIQTGVSRISDQSNGFFLLPVDIPLVQQSSVRLMARSFAESPVRVLYPVFNCRRGHPPLLAADLIPAIIEQRNPEGGLRSLLARITADQSDQVREIPVTDPYIHIDIDTPEEYLACCQYVHRRNVSPLTENDFPRPTLKKA